MSKNINENVRQHFEDVIDRIKIALNTNKDTVVAESLGLQATAFYNRRKNGSLPLKNIVGWASKKQISIDWLITGDGFMVLTDAEIALLKKDEVREKEQTPIPGTQDLPTETKEPSSNLTKVVIEHQDMIRRFKNPEKAKEFNEILIEIEDGDPDGYDELFKEAKTISKTIKRLNQKKKPENKNDLQNNRSS